VKRPSRWIRIGAACVVGLGAAGIAYQRFYARPKAELVAELDARLDEVAQHKAAIERLWKVRQELRAFGQTTLGTSEDRVKHRLRTTLNNIAAGCQLEGVVVSDGPARPMPSLVTKAKGFARLGRSVTDTFRRPDGELIQGQVRGVGKLEDVLRSLAVVSAQPWVHRVEGFSIKPVNKEADRFELAVDVATIVTPDIESPAQGEPLTVALAADAEGQWSGVVAKNMFRLPPAPPVTPAVAASGAGGVQAEAPAPPGTPYGEWRVTGVAHGRAGVEVWLVNVRTSERKTLGVGAAVLDAVFVSGVGERAVFEIGGAKFEVATGGTLAERRPFAG